MKHLAAHELNLLVAHGEARLVDVRTPAEFRGAHLAGARSEPLDTLSGASLVAAGYAKDRPVHLICHAGKRAERAAEKLAAEGFTQCVVLTGGMQAWEAAGLPVERAPGPAVIGLERQVRIVAGALVLLGVLLGAFVDPACLILPGFVGAGLIFAGVTDRCGMALLLTKLPWNRR